MKYDKTVEKCHVWIKISSKTAMGWRNKTVCWSVVSVKCESENDNNDREKNNNIEAVDRKIFLGKRANFIDQITKNTS